MDVELIDVGSFGRQCLKFRFPNGYGVSYNVGERHFLIERDGDDVTEYVKGGLPVGHYSFGVMYLSNYSELGRLLDFVESIARAETIKKNLA